MDRAELLTFLRRHRVAVEASVHPAGGPQAAVIGVAFTDRLEVVFDTVASTRKYTNLRADPRIALVVSSDDETAQIEGLADFPTGAELDHIRAAYFLVYPDGRDRLAWPGITHVRVRPTWIRFTSYRSDPPRIVTLDGPALGGA